MGLRVTYHCAACGFSSGELAVGWGKGGRRSFWGGLALCPSCQALSVVNLGEVRSEWRDYRCAQCNGLLKLLEGIGEAVTCPHCGTSLQHVCLGSWM